MTETQHQFEWRNLVHARDGLPRSMQQLRSIRWLRVTVGEEALVARPLWTTICTDIIINKSFIFSLIQFITCNYLLTCLSYRSHGHEMPMMFDNYPMSLTASGQVMNNVEKIKIQPYYVPALPMVITDEDIKSNDDLREYLMNRGDIYESTIGTYLFIFLLP